MTRSKILVALILLCSPSLAAVQTTAGRVSGVVDDHHRRSPIPSVSVVEGSCQDAIPRLCGLRLNSLFTQAV